MEKHNFNPFSCDGDYLNSQVKGWTGDVGRYRVQYKVYPCGKATIIGQQMQNDKGLMTIRKYNPKKHDVPLHIDVD